MLTIPGLDIGSKLKPAAASSYALGTRLLGQKEYDFTDHLVMLRFNFPTKRLGYKSMGMEIITSRLEFFLISSIIRSDGRNLGVLRKLKKHDLTSNTKKPTRNGLGAMLWLINIVSMILDWGVFFLLILSKITIHIILPMLFLKID